jgi:tripartite-type tricarboxylate transporter receptor subunit TctC
MVDMRSCGLLLAATCLTCAASVGAQSFPQKPIRIVTSETGSGTDLAARIIAQALTGRVGQQVIVDNRALFGAVDIVTKAPPDGYSLLFYGSGAWLAPFMHSKTSFDPLRDLAAVTLAIQSPSLLVVNASVAAQSIKDLIALARARPGELNYSSGSIGGAAHLAAELFNRMAAVNIVRVQYKGSGPSLNAVIAGEVQLMFPATGSVTPHLKAGRIRALAVTSALPSPLAPGLPTIAETGLPGYESVSLVGMFAPARTPGMIIDRLSSETAQVLRKSEVRDKILNAALEPVGNTPSQFAAIIREDMSRTGKLIRDLGIKTD